MSATRHFNTSVLNMITPGSLEFTIDSWREGGGEEREKDYYNRRKKKENKKKSKNRKIVELKWNKGPSSTWHFQKITF